MSNGGKLDDFGAELSRTLDQDGHRATDKACQYWNMTCAQDCPSEREDDLRVP